MTLHGMRIYWLVWSIASFVTFFVPEVIAVSTRHFAYTLSDSVWYIESFVPGQPISLWSVGHIWFIGVYGILVLWLFFHFGMGWWK